MRRVLVVIVMALVGFLASFAGDLGAAFLRGDAPLLAGLTGLVVIAIVLKLAAWAVDNV